MNENFKQRSVDEFIEEHRRNWKAMSPEEQEAQRERNKVENDIPFEEYFKNMYSELAKSLNIPENWIYRDLPRMTKSVMEWFLEEAGDGVRFITYAEYPNGSCRGQCFISPEVYKRITKKDYK